MKKLIFKTTGWILMIISIIGVFQVDPVESPWKFILQIIVVITIDSIFDLGLDEKASNIKKWFLK